MRAQGLDSSQARPLPPLSLTIINNEDDFAHMLGHMFRHMGATVRVIDNRDYDPAQSASDILVIGPGPGDPTNIGLPEMARLQAFLKQARSRGTPILGICLGHQAIAVLEGLTVTRQPDSTQGMQREVTVFGKTHRLGFYNSFSPLADNASAARTDIACDIDENGRIIAMRGADFIGFQFHPESVMSETGYELLREAVLGLSSPKG
jgi:phenazine biosynthesis protein phzE